MTDAGPGTVLDGKYRLLHPLGQGGMGVVWAAEHEALGRRVAVKLLRREFAEDQGNLRRFAQEASAAIRIGSPHIVTILDFGSAPGGAPYLAMELLSGETLGAALHDRPPMALPRAIDIVGQILAGLGAAHACGIVHRDIKPENVFLTRFGERPDFVKLLDFGLSRVLSGETATRLTRTGAMLGTPTYMSPEQVMGSRDLDQRADIWSVAVVLYLALTRRRPFEGPTVADRLAAIVAAKPPPLLAYRPDLEPRLEKILRRDLARDPAQRIASAEGFRALLAPYAKGIPSPYATHLGTPAVIPPVRAACPDPATVDAFPARVGAPTAVAVPPAAAFVAPRAAAVAPRAAPPSHARSPKPTADRRPALLWVAAAVVAGAAFVAVLLLLVLDSGGARAPESRTAVPAVAAGPVAPAGSSSADPAAAAPATRLVAADRSLLPAFDPAVAAERERYVRVTVETMCWEMGRFAAARPVTASESRGSFIGISGGTG